VEDLARLEETLEVLSDPAILRRLAESMRNWPGAMELPLRTLPRPCGVDAQPLIG
jgi:hypothetical protein